MGYLSSLNVKIAKKIIYWIWAGIVITLLAFFIASPATFSPENIAVFMHDYQGSILFVYTLASLIRGMFLIPSTAFVLAGIILFPDRPWFVVTVSMIGILLGATAIYYFSDLLGFSEKLEKKYPKQLKTWHRRLSGPKATLIVTAWSFFPLVPTDLICYVAGIVKMPYRYVMLGVFVGEIVLVSCYVFAGQGIFEYLF